MENQTTDIITYDDFAKLRLKTGKVLECIKAENSEKLYILQVDLGEEKPRQIVSSLVDYYTAEELIGKEIIVLANLKPAKMRGHLSEGMLLCAETPDSSVCVLLKPETSVAAGTDIT
ncbi:MAG: methionine--tRNA ligase subunit beta [Treponema phagedenis]|uniref:methionine--tRNA ligase subunit beta n=1 Tax=Treponema phagedenis TaxID=162 RepID=UPI003133D16A